MIHYQLRCGQAHEFDGWFKDSANFESQAKRRLIECPECGATDVQRALMAPAVSTREAIPAPATPQATEGEVLPPERKVAAGGRAPAQVVAMLQRLRSEVEKNCDYVGNEFADEARKMHRGESERRAIYGETTPEQAESLADEGIEVTAIPWVPRADG
ncbi:MAG TPA: DUF1178 family protein [Rhodopila sp.]|uniref:DUF1178 family protein n=1 Tax=Rhodopila sp. TaxID=2480087 RepID=UPI002C2DFB3C|nr:DUF1178 family protein [Rhodopila sp.]HVY17050.1 DUF1178 family protein [Rhodopila sp.]